jgi:hypothetical protein
LSGRLAVCCRKFRAIDRFLARFDRALAACLLPVLTWTIALLEPSRKPLLRYLDREHKTRSCRIGAWLTHLFSPLPFTDAWLSQTGGPRIGRLGDLGRMIAKIDRFLTRLGARCVAWLTPWLAPVPRLAWAWLAPGAHPLSQRLKSECGGYATRGGFGELCRSARSRLADWFAATVGNDKPCLPEYREPRYPWCRKLAGALLTVVMLIPVPAYATLTIGNWLIISTDPTVINATQDPTHTTLTFTPFAAGTGDFTISGSSRAISDGTSTLTATFNNWNNISGQGNATFEVTYNGTNLFPVTTGLTGEQMTLPLNNQFSAGTSLVSGNKPISFEVHFLAGSTWSTAASPLPTLVISTP